MISQIHVVAHRLRIDRKPAPVAVAMAAPPAAAYAPPPVITQLASSSVLDDEREVLESMFDASECMVLVGERVRLCVVQSVMLELELDGGYPKTPAK
eukprot:3796357-Prymnesium_polylepis.1